MDFTDVTVLCIGDLMVDRFMYGKIERISPEAPIPIIHLTRTQEMLGGAGNVGHNIATLGGRALLVGLVGKDALADTMLRLADGIAGIVPCFVATDRRPTICKTRFVASQQQVVRADEESLLPLQADEERDLLAVMEQALPQASAIILSDYGKGVLSPAVIGHVMAHALSRGVPVFVDPKTDDFSRYRHATCITPNTQELAAASGLAVDGDAAVEAAARKVMADAGAASILATRSERGMMLVEAGGPTHSVPARAREVFDVSGAGDTVIAAMALAHASGLSLSRAMHIANAAAGVVVSKLGTATVTVDEVLQELESSEGMLDGELLGLRSLTATLALVARWKGQGLRVGFTLGCFDIIHPGHVAHLKAARAECDRLIVGLHGDASAQRLKHRPRLANDLQSRAQVTAAIVYVDCVVGFDEATPTEIIQRLAPAVLVTGADDDPEAALWADIVRRAGGRVVLPSLAPGPSTPAMVNQQEEAVPRAEQAP